VSKSSEKPGHKHEKANEKQRQKQKQKTKPNKRQKQQTTTAKPETLEVVRIAADVTNILGVHHHCTQVKRSERCKNYVIVLI
jgi:hypothetical protein